MVNMAKVTALGIQKYDVIFVESKNNENREIYPNGSLHHHHSDLHSMWHVAYIKPLYY